MPPFSLRIGTPTCVLVLEAPTHEYRHALDGHQRDRLRTQFDQFLTGEPESALEPAGKLRPPLRQLKDRGGNVRALGSWCPTDTFDLLFVQAIYRKQDEAAYLSETERFAERGGALVRTWEGRTLEDLRSAVSEWDADDALLVWFEDGD